MDIQSDISSLSGSSSRKEQMAYLAEELGLDRTTAAMLYRAEQLQEKGQLKQATKYFEAVLRKYPGCSEGEPSYYQDSPCRRGQQRGTQVDGCHPRATTST